MKRLLVVVDYQKDFIDGSLGFPGALNLDEKIVDVIKQFDNKNDEIVFTMDTHGDEYFDTIEGRSLPIKHCEENTEGWQLADSIQKYAVNRKIFKKNKYGSIELGKYISEHQNEISDIYLCGLVSEICVFSNAMVALAASNPNCKIHFYSKVTATVHPEMEQKALDLLNYLQVEII